MKDVLAKLLARRGASAAAPTRFGPAPVASRIEASIRLEPAVCELCEADWGALSADDIAELLVASGRFPEEERESLLALPRELLVSVFCGCSAKLRLAPPLAPTSSAARRARP
jgi:hypothetical protein